MTNKSNFFIAISFLTVLNTRCQLPEKNVIASTQDKIDSTYQKAGVPGIFVAILNDNQRSYFSSGFADVEKKLKFDSATFFEIGSITKTFTAYTLLSILKDKGIDDGSSIVNYLPDSVKENPSLQNITFLSLMNHTSGFPRLPDNMNLDESRQPYENYTAVDLFSYLKDCTIKADGKSNYSNLGAGLAGVLAEMISGKTYAELLDQYIFLPFKMVTPDKAFALSNNKSQGYFQKNDKTDYWNMNVLAPAGGLKCNGVEMLAYLQNMAFPETTESKQIVDKLTTPTIALNQQISVGRGWHILQLKDQPDVYWHNGGTYGFSTFCAFLKNKSKAVLVVINQFNKNEISDGLGIQLIKQLMSEE